MFKLALTLTLAAALDIQHKGGRGGGGGRGPKEEKEPFDGCQFEDEETTRSVYTETVGDGEGMTIDML